MFVIKLQFDKKNLRQVLGYPKILKKISKKQKKQKLSSFLLLSELWYSIMQVRYEEKNL
jgi:hypothetical protein